MKQIPSKLYRYGSLEKPEYLREVLLDNKIYCTCPFDFNDPFDCRPRLVVGNTTNELKAAQKVVENILKKRSTLDRSSRKKEAKRILREIKTSKGITEAFESLLGRAGVFCLTGKRDNLLMWAHYADKHRGFCLEFEAGSPGSFFSKAEPIQYEKDYPTVRIFTADKEDWGKESFLTKSIEWKYEDEWRLASRESGHLSFPPELLTGIILGCKISSKHIEMIRDWVSNRKQPIKIEMAVMNDRQFKVNIIQFVTNV